MSFINDLLKTKYSDIPPAAGEHTTKPSEEDILWERHKQKIDSLPANYQEVARKVLTANPHKVRRYERKDLRAATFEVLTKSPYYTVLEIHEKEMEGVQKVRYISYNDNLNRAYIRDILGD